MTTKLHRRDWFTWTTSAVGSALILGTSPSPSSAARQGLASHAPFGFCLNTSTIRDRGEVIPIDRQVAIAAEAGYQAIEPWIRDLDRYIEQGGSLADLKRRIEDSGLSVESAIGFFPWAVDDDEVRSKGLEEARRNMDLLREIGGKRIAAPPSGATEQSDLNLFHLAERYRALLELGADCGVVPQLEVWGFSKTLSRLGEAAFVAMESGHPDACILPDVYHIYKGGSDFQGLSLLSGSSIHVFHVNDYPAEPPRSEIKDADRVYPGDGIAPLSQILRQLDRIGFRRILSLELFHPGYWKADPLKVARDGLKKMKDMVAAAELG